MDAGSLPNTSSKGRMLGLFVLQRRGRARNMPWDKGAGPAEPGRPPANGLGPGFAAALGLHPSCVAGGVDECLVVAWQALGWGHGAASRAWGGAALPVWG
jgi:hypothetical protein